MENQQPSYKQFSYLCKDGVWRDCNDAAIQHMKDMADKSKGKFTFEYKQNW